MREAAALMAPIALWLLRSGVSYPVFAEMLKAVFVNAAAGELARADTKPTQSALSLLSGVHRKDVRALGETPAVALSPPRPPLSQQVFTRWLTDARYRGADGKPRALARAGARRSFEGLCAELSSDVHPRAVLDELLRLGLVALDGERVVVRATSFVPSARLDEMTAVMSANVADHIAAAVSNLSSNGPEFLEHSIYADGLTVASIEQLHHVAGQAWSRAFDTVVAEARERVEHDFHSDGEQRMRFGVYFYSETAPTPGPSPTAPRTKTPSRTPRTRRRNPP
jgi:Family of unknown function (DUF6502)